ncbi:MAG: glycosyltransferase [Gemmatimonadota bacterium]|nr:glycosyltransferase [Gemmatimonadota bacterium]
MSTNSTFIDRISSNGPSAHKVDIGHDALPPKLRPVSSLGVLDVTEWFGDTSGGIRTYLLQKALYVASRPWLRHVLAVPGARDSIVDEDGVRMYRLQGPPIPRQKPYRFMLATHSIAKIVRHECPDIIEVGSPFIVPWIMRRATRDLEIPMVCFYHSNLPRMFAPRDGRNGLTRRAVYRGAWRYMRRLDRLFPLTVVTSDYSANDLAREGITRIARVPLGVDLEQFHPDNRELSAETRTEFGIPDGPVAGFVGRFASEKELGMLLDAWPAVERRCGARLVLVGTGPLEPTLRSHAYAPRVTFVPFQSDRETLAKLLACFDVYVSPGRIETFGLSSLEALASGTPVLSANEGGVSEQVAGSKAGRVFEAGLRASVSEQAIALFESNLTELGARGRAYAEREHSWSFVFDRLFEVYRDVLAR